MKELNPIKADLRLFSQAQSQVALALDAMSEITEIVDKDMSNNALLVLKGCSKVDKLIESKRKELNAPVLAEQKRINAYAKSLTEGVPAEIKRVKVLLQNWQAEQNRIEEEKRRVAQEEADRVNAENEANEDPDSLEAMMNESLTSHEIDKEEVLPEKIEATQVKGMRVVTKFEVTDEVMVPKGYFTIDEKKIRVAIKDGVTQISGVRIYKENQLAV